MIEAASNIEFLPATFARSFHVIRPMAQISFPLPHHRMTRAHVEQTMGSRDKDLACTTSETIYALAWSGSI
jgi:hypothetical protein